MARPVRKILGYGFAALLLGASLLWLAAWWADPWRLLTVQAHLVQWLDDCPKNGVRFVCNSGPSYHLYGYANLLRDDLVRIGTMGVGGDDYMNTGGVTITVGPMMDTPISPAQKTEIDRLLKLMPERRRQSWESYDFDRNIYFAFWKAHVLQIYAYPKNDLSQSVVDLLNVFAPNLIDMIKNSR